MKQYTKLEVPKDSAWDRKTWRGYAPIWFLNLFDGVRNIIRWMPTLYKDKDWDDYYITKMLQKKIEFQREYLVKANRHTEIERDNRDMTLILNLIERMHEEFYALEKYNYVEFGDSIFSAHKSHNLEDYLAKYPGTVKKVIKKYPDRDFSDPETLSLFVGTELQIKNDSLVWKIMAERSHGWWD